MKNLLVQQSIWKNDILDFTKREFIIRRDYQKPWYIISPENTYIEYWSKLMTILLMYTAINSKINYNNIIMLESKPHITYKPYLQHVFTALH